MKKTLLILLSWGKVFSIKSIFILKFVFRQYIKTRATAIIVSYAIFLFAFITYYLNLVFTAPVEAEIDSFQYSLFVGRIIKDFPTFKPLQNSKRFSFKLGRQNNGIRDALRFDSQASVTEIISYYQIYFDIIKANPVYESIWTKSFIMYGGESNVFYVSVTNRGAYRRVLIERYLN